MEGGLINPLALIRTGAAEGVTSLGGAIRSGMAAVQTELKGAFTHGVADAVEEEETERVALVAAGTASRLAAARRATGGWS